MKIKKLLDFVNKNYLFFPEEERNYLINLDINKFFLSAFTRINANKKLVKIWVKLLEFKEDYKKNPCEFDYTKCNNEKQLIKWFKFIVFIKNPDKLDSLFDFWKEKYWETQNYKKFYEKYLVTKNDILKKLEEYKETEKFKLSIQQLERLIYEKNDQKAKLLLKKLIANYPEKIKLYNYFEKISKTSAEKYKENLENLKEENEIDFSILSSENYQNQNNETYENLSDKKLIQKLNIFLKKQELEKWIKLSNYILEHRKNINKRKVKKIKQKLIKIKLDQVKKEQQKEYNNELKILEKLIQDKRQDRALWLLQWLFSKYSFINKKWLKKYIPKIYKLEQEQQDIKNINKLELFLFKYTKLTEKDLFFFYDKMAWFISAQMDIKTALTILQWQAKSIWLKKLTYKLISWINTWKNITDILSEFKEIPRKDLSMIKVSEQVWSFDKTFTTLKQMYEDIIFRKRKIKSMLIYPSITIFVAFVIIVLMLMFVFPKFVEIYNQFDIELPLPTRIMLFLSDFLQNNFIIFLWSIIWFIIFITLFFKTKIWYIVKSWLLLKIPIIRELHKKNETLLFLENFSAMLKWWLSISEILDFLIEWTSNYFFQKEFTLIKMLVLSWDPISKAMGIQDNIVAYKSSILPIDIWYAISVWEKTWKLTEIIENLLGNYKKEFKLYLDNFQQVIEPSLILIIWWLIFILVLAIFLPMMWIYQQIAKQTRF